MAKPISLYHKQGVKTVPLVQTQAPLKVQQPFYPEGPQTCHTVLLHTAGGMVGGDRLSIDITLDADTEALVTTAAAAKIYSDHPQQLPAQIQGHVQVGAGACLEWFPQETIVFEGAHYHPLLASRFGPRRDLGGLGYSCDWGARLAESDSPRGASART
jgi:urease accessory protein